jgi:hypothetical protein
MARPRQEPWRRPQKLCCWTTSVIIPTCSGQFAECRQICFDNVEKDGVQVPSNEFLSKFLCWWFWFPPPRVRSKHATRRPQYLPAGGVDVAAAIQPSPVVGSESFQEQMAVVLRLHRTRTPAFLYSQCKSETQAGKAIPCMLPYSGSEPFSFKIKALHALTNN